MENKTNGFILKPGFLAIAGSLFVLVVYVCLELPMVINAAKYAQVSREILASGDWINLTIAGDPYDQKPPLLFWTGAVFFRLFGISTPVWKLSILLVSFLGIFSVYRLGKLLYNRETGILAGLFYACSLGFLYYHNDIHTDTILADMVIFSIWQLAEFFTHKRNLNFYLGIVGTGLAMLAKGPVGMVIPAMAVGIHLLCHRRWRDIFHLRWLIAGLIVGVMIIPALLGLYNQFGADGIKFYFWTNNIGRITGSYYTQNATDPFFYLHTSLYMLAPVTIFAVFGLFILLGKQLKARGKFSATDELYTVGGILPYLLVLSVSKTKNPHYLMAVVPLFMILAARFTLLLNDGNFSRKLEKTVSALNVVVASVFWIITGIFVFWFFPEKNPWYWIWITLFAGLTAWSQCKTRGIPRQIALLILSVLAFMFSLNFSFYPALSAYHSPFRVIETFNRQAADGEQIHLYLRPSRYWEIFFYARNPGRYYMTENELPVLLKENKDWVFTDTEGKNQILKTLPETEIIAEYDHRSLSQMSLPFLNPATRAKKLEKRYLLHLP